MRDEFDQSRRETWLLRRLRRDIVAVGVTSTDQRAQLVRDELERLGWQDKTAGKRDGKAITYRDVFVSVYGEEL